MRSVAGTTPRRRPPIRVPVMEPAAMTMTKVLFAAATVKLLSRLQRANATSMVGRETARERLPAILMSTA